MNSNSLTVLQRKLNRIEEIKGLIKDIEDTQDEKIKVTITTKEYHRFLEDVLTRNKRHKKEINKTTLIMILERFLEEEREATESLIKECAID